MDSVYLRLLTAVAITLIFSIFPMPEILSGLRPPLTLLLILYIQLFLPAYYSLFVVLLISLCMDVLMSTVMGEHAFALFLVGWAINNRARRFQFFAMGQQMLIVGFLCMIYQAALLSIDAFSGFHYSMYTIISSAVIGMLFWPWLKILADDVILLKLRR